MKITYGDIKHSFRRYREFLLSLVDLGEFPPPGTHICGMPKQLYEATISSIDAQLALYALAKQGSYNQRAVGSQVCEGLFSDIASISPNGVPRSVEVDTLMARICGDTMVRLDPERFVQITETDY